VSSWRVSRDCKQPPVSTAICLYPSSLCFFKTTTSKKTDTSNSTSSSKTYRDEPAGSVSVEECKQCADSEFVILTWEFVEPNENHKSDVTLVCVYNNSLYYLLFIWWCCYILDYIVLNVRMISELKGCGRKCLASPFEQCQSVIRIEFIWNYTCLLHFNINLFSSHIWLRSVHVTELWFLRSSGPR
jgi:hypothetical protein